MSQPTLCLLAIAMALAAPVGAQRTCNPAKGQTPEKQKSDEAACYSWAVQQTGFDPAEGAAADRGGADDRDRHHPRRRSARRCEGCGRRRHRGRRGHRCRRRRRRPGAARAADRMHAAQQQQGGASQQQQAAFAKARAACLEGKGYTIK